MNTIRTKIQSFFCLQNILLIAHLFTAYACIGQHVVQASQKSLDQIRYELHHYGITEKNIQHYPSLEILEKEPKGTRYGNCHTYAISKLLGLKGQMPAHIPIVDGIHLYTEFNFLQDYCKEVFQPQPGDLVVYEFQHHGYFTIEHTGIYHADGTVESKWGANRRIYKGPMFYIPSPYGDRVKYYRINQPIHTIIKDLQKKISQAHYQKQCTHFNQRIISYAEQSENEKVWKYLKYCMCIDINATNANNETLLMIARKNNNTALEKMLLAYQPD